MFKRMLQPSSALGRPAASAEELNPGLPTPSVNERPRTEPAPTPDHAKLSSFDEIYSRSNFKPPAGSAEYNILKVAEMTTSDQLHGLSPAAKHGALMMALEAAGVAVEDILQDAMQRQRALEAYEALQTKRLEEFESAKLKENEKLEAELEAISVQYRARIAAAVNEIDRERAAFRDWQERKGREQRRMAEAAALCVTDPGAISSEASVTRLLEKSAASLRQSA